MASTQSSAVPMTTSDHHHQDRPPEVMHTEGRSTVAPGSSLHHTGAAGGGFHAGEGEDHADERHPVADQASAWVAADGIRARCGTPPTISSITTTTAGTASQMAMLPVCFGPKKVNARR